MVSSPIHHHVTSHWMKLGHITFHDYDLRSDVYPDALRELELTRGQGDIPAAADALVRFHRGFNPNFYRFRPSPFPWDAHRAEVQALLRRSWSELTKFGPVPIERLPCGWREAVVRMFQEFETVLGPVGAAKCLHVLAPDTFPLWDRRIAASYRLRLRKAGQNGERYWTFMTVAARQCRWLRDEGWEGPILKMVDEFNFCKFTKQNPRFAGSPVMPYRPPTLSVQR